MNEDLEEIDFTKAGNAKQEVLSVKDNIPSAIVEEDESTNQLSAKKSVIYCIIILLLILGSFILWRYYYFTPTLESSNLQQILKDKAWPTQIPSLPPSVK